jgi:hypothetical protein
MAELFVPDYEDSKRWQCYISTVGFWLMSYFNAATF